MKRKAEAVLHPDVMTLRGVKSDKPGVFEWCIEGIGVYIGESNRMARVLPHYNARLRSLVNQGSGDEENGFRTVYHALAEGLRESRNITLTFRENIPVRSDRLQRVKELIQERWKEMEQSGLMVLNRNYRPSQILR